MKLNRKIPVTAALLIVLLITLLAGLKPKGYRFRNDASWVRRNDGIVFGPIGIAFTRDSLQWMQPGARDSGFTIEMSLKTGKTHTGGIGNILSFWDGVSPDPLMVGQWKNHLIVRIRDSRSKRGYRECGAGGVLALGKKVLIHIVSTRAKTVVYCNGVITGDSVPASVIAPAGLRGQLVAGNSVTAGEPWTGEIGGMAIYNREISPAEAMCRFCQWDSSARMGLPPAVGAAHVYRFDEAGGTVARDRIAAGFDLHVPRIFHIIQKRVLVGPWDDFQWSRSYFSDVVINLFGFMPLGACIALFAFEIAAIPLGGKNMLLTVLGCFILSLCIELAQVYIPTRASQLSDLFLNTLGGGVGGLLTKMAVVKYGGNNQAFKRCGQTEENETGD
jgi:hypothetical protein